MFTNLALSLGLTRDSRAWLYLRLLSVAGMITSGALDVVGIGAYLGIHLSPIVAHWITAISVVLLWTSGTYATSPLPGGPDKPIDLSKLRVWFIVALLSIGAVTLPACGGHTPPQLPDVQAIAAKTDKDLRAVEMKAYGVLQAAGVVLNQASSIEADLAKTGAIPPTADRQLKAGMASTAKRALDVIDAIEQGHIHTYEQLKAQIDPVLAEIAAVRELVQPSGHPRLMAVVDVLAEVAAQALMSQTGAGMLR